MPNNTVRASGEALPTINRRRMLIGMAAIPACGLAAIVPAVSVAAPTHSDDALRDPEMWIALWRNATPEARWEALCILRAGAAREAKAVKS